MADQNVTIKIGADTSDLQPAIDNTKSAVSSTTEGMAGLATQAAEVTKQFTEGANPLTIFAEHAQDVFSAISKVKGITTGVIGLMGGPWGAAISAAVAVTGTLVGKLFDTSERAKQAASAMKDFQKSQEDIGKFIDATTGKLKEQNTTLRQNFINQQRNQLAAQQANVHQSQKDANDAAVKILEQAGSRRGRGGNPLVDRAIFGSNGNLQKLSANLEAIRPKISSTFGVYIDQVTAAAAETVEFSRRTKELTNEMAVVAGNAPSGRQGKAVPKKTDTVIAHAGAIEQPRSTPIHITTSLADITTPTLQVAATKARVIMPAATTTDSANEPASGKEVNNIIGAADKPLPLSKPLDNLLQSATKTYTAISKVGDKVATEQQKSWKDMANSIAGAFGSSLQGMIKGTQNFRGMMLNIGNAILGDATKWIQKKVVTFLTGELAQTGAAQAGVATRGAVEATGAATSTALSATNSLTQIAHRAAVAAAGAFSSTVVIPIIGPVKAPIVAAAALAAVLALGKMVFSAEGGMGQVPYDGAMFELHKDEMVLPASLATPMRSMLLNPAANYNGQMAANDRGVTHNHYYDIKGLDGQDVHRVLMRHQGAVARAAEKAYRYGYKPK